MNIEIGPYKLLQRTKYSKIQITDTNEKSIDKELEEKIIDDYNKQINHPERYFDIQNKMLMHYMEHDDIKFVFIPDEVIDIYQQSFMDSNIHFIHLPDKLLSFGYDVFKNCTELEEVRLPNSMQKISHGAFDNCVSLKKVILPDKIKEIPMNAFKNCISLSEMVIPDTVKAFHSQAFASCKNYKKVNMPKNLEYFSPYPFVESGIETLQINYDIKKNRDWTRFGNYMLDTQIYKLEISDNVRYIDPAFLKHAGGRITAVDYKGCKKEFETFRSDNRALFKLLANANVHVEEDNIDILLENKSPRNIIEKLFTFER